MYTVAVDDGAESTAVTVPITIPDARVTVGLGGSAAEVLVFAETRQRSAPSKEECFIAVEMTPRREIIDVVEEALTEEARTPLKFVELLRRETWLVALGSSTPCRVTRDDHPSHKQL